MNRKLRRQQERKNKKMNQIQGQKIQGAQQVLSPEQRAIQQINQQVYDRAQLVKEIWAMSLTRGTLLDFDTLTTSIDDFSDKLNKYTMAFANKLIAEWQVTAAEQQKKYAEAMEKQKKAEAEQQTSNEPAPASSNVVVLQPKVSVENPGEEKVQKVEGVEEQQTTEEQPQPQE